MSGRRKGKIRIYSDGSGADEASCFVTVIQKKNIIKCYEIWLLHLIRSVLLFVKVNGVGENTGYTEVCSEKAWNNTACFPRSSSVLFKERNDYNSSATSLLLLCSSEMSSNTFLEKYIGYIWHVWREVSKSFKQPHIGREAVTSLSPWKF